MEQFTGKTAFITGAASGMGLGMVKVFAAHGMRVVMADIRQHALDEAMAELGGMRDGILPLQLDVTDREAYARAADAAESAFGRLHILVNNAGNGITGLPIQEASYKDWDFVLGVNLGGVVNGIVTILPRILAHGEAGHVVTTSSTCGFSAVGGVGLYCTSKYALTGMMESLATDLQDTCVGVSIYFPGPVRTSLGETTEETRPEHLKNPEPPPPRPQRPPAARALFMDPEEAGKRVLNGIRRKDLFIMSHPEFRAGLAARHDALLRAIPDEPVNQARHELLKSFGTLLYNPVYDRQTTPPCLE